MLLSELITGIKKANSKNPLTQEIHEIYEKPFSQNTTVTIIWTTSRTGITGNETADNVDKLAATTKIQITNLQTHNDLKYLFINHLRDSWQTYWDTTHSVQNAPLRLLVTLGRFD